MSNIKLTDNEIKKTLQEMADYPHNYEEGQDLQNALDLINRYEKEKSKAWELFKKKCDENIELQMICDKQKAEVERLKNAYKQCAWERDIFAEDMKEEIKKDCSYLMLDIKTIKAEVYKECIEKVKETSNKTELVCSGALVRTDYTITKKTLDNLLKEFERKENTVYDD